MADDVRPKGLGVDQDVGEFGHTSLWQESCSLVTIRDDS